VTLPEPLLAFWSAWEGLSLRCEPHPWGLVATDSRYPKVWDANHAGVFTGHADLTAAEIRRALLPAVRQAGAEWEHVEMWDPPARCPTMRQLERTAERTGADVIMVFRGGPDDLPRRPLPPTDAAARELADLDEAFWELYWASRDEFGDPLERELVAQMVRRDREVMVPAGLRVFGGFLDGEMAGFASLISLAGVGYVDNVVTMPAVRRRGVAGATVRAAVAASLGGGDRAVHLLAHPGSAAQGLYERIGFEVLGHVLSATRPA
jgi:ribosomal protein S18 acetylase RimI-like enzyme